MSANTNLQALSSGGDVYAKKRKARQEQLAEVTFDPEARKYVLLFMAFSSCRSIDRVYWVGMGGLTLASGFRLSFKKNGAKIMMPCPYLIAPCHTIPYHTMYQKLTRISHFFLIIFVMFG